MSTKFLLLLCVLGLAHAASNQDLSATVTTDGVTESHKDLLVRLHNEYRCRHTTELQEVDHDQDSSTAKIYLPKISMVHWSDVLEKAAKCWALKMASTGSFAHSYGECGTTGMGENIAYYGGSGTGDIKARIESSMKAFYDEYANLKSGNANGQSTNGKAVGHFTQIAWKDTTTIGCGAAVRPASSGEPYDKWYLSCSYKSPGNYGGRYADNVKCSNSNGAACVPWDQACKNSNSGQCGKFDYSAAKCATAIAFEDTAGKPEFHGTDDTSIISGTSASSPHTTRPGYHSDVTSLHATKVCWTTKQSSTGTAPSNPTCSQTSNCESSNHHQFDFNYGSSDKDDILVIKMIGCSGGGNSGVSTEYFKLADALPPAPITFDPRDGTSIPTNSHIHAYSRATAGSTSYQSSSKMCWTINDPGATVRHPTCTQSTNCETDHPDEVDLVVDHDETVAVVACVKKLDGTWVQEPSSGSTQASYTVVDTSGSFTDCDSALKGGFASFLKSYCNAGCYSGYHKYLLINNKCNSVGYDYKTSKDATLAANPGKLVADTDGSRCGTLGVSGASVCNQGGAAEEGSKAGTSSAGWTTSTTIVLVVALVATVVVGIVAFLAGKRASVNAKQPKQPLTDLAEELEA